MPYVDVHTHLTHKNFHDDLDAVIERAIAADLSAIVVNGLEPKSNRQIQELHTRYPQIKIALGIYPLEAVNGLIKGKIEIPVVEFDVDEEITWIEEQAKAGNCHAIGECGLDAYWVGEETFAEQERVFLRLAQIAHENELPLIIHTRKREKRSIEILAHHGIQKVNFHCYGGKTKLAIDTAEKYGWYFSIPANARKNEAFGKLLRSLPAERILTETDAPYLAPQRGERNEPANVVATVAYLAELRSWEIEEASRQVWNNYLELFTS